MSNSLSPFNVALLLGIATSQPAMPIKTDTRPLGAESHRVSFIMNPQGAQPKSQLVADKSVEKKLNVDLLRSIMRYSQPTYSVVSSATHEIKIQQWFSEMSNSLIGIQSEAMAEGAVVPSDAVLRSARSALVVCSKSSVEEPAITHDDKGGIEIFFKNKEKAILIVIQFDGFITLYGDDLDEQWRGRYKASGTAWKRHLSSHIAEVAAV